MPIPTRPFVGTPDRGTAFPVLGDVKSIRVAVAFTSLHGLGLFSDSYGQGRQTDEALTW